MYGLSCELLGERRAAPRIFRSRLPMRSLDPTPLRVSTQEMEELDWLGTATRRYKGVPRAAGIDGTRLLWSQRHSLTEWRMARTKSTDSSIFYLSLFPRQYGIKISLPSSSTWILCPTVWWKQYPAYPPSWHPLDIHRPSLKCLNQQVELRLSFAWHSVHNSFSIFAPETVGSSHSHDSRKLSAHFWRHLEVLASPIHHVF